MKALNPIKTSAFIIALFLATAIHSQTTKTILYPEAPNQKIKVDLKITPSNKQFQVTVQTVDSSQYKVRLTIFNAEEKSCTINIISTAGNLWSIRIKEAYFSQVFNLSQLDDGNYTIKVTNGKRPIRKKAHPFNQ
jgi:YbbR domain-containing protein